MPAPIETEIKLRMDGPDAARAELARLGAVPVRARHFEDNVLFDDRARSVAGRGSTLRLRRTGDGGPAVLTFKGPRRDAGGVKQREEVETDVADPDGLTRVLEALGYRPAFRYQKFREVYRWRDVEIVVDETPIGTFVEIEGAAESIHEAARRLDRGPDEYVTESYVGLFVAAGGTGDMVFSDPAGGR